MGLVFKLTPSSNGWIYTDLHDFTGGDDGCYPWEGVALDGQGNLYGTASQCGPYGAYQKAGWYGLGDHAVEFCAGNNPTARATVTNSYLGVSW